MKTFLLAYTQVLESGHDQIGEVNIIALFETWYFTQISYFASFFVKVHVEFRQKCDEMTTDKLLDQFVSLKNTGTTRPGISFPSS